MSAYFQLYFFHKIIKSLTSFIRRSYRIHRYVGLLALLLLILLPREGWTKTELSFATLSPKSTIWGRYIRNIVKEAYTESGKEVWIRVYYGGVQGDEIEMKDKIALGQLDGGFFTGNGLGALAPEVRILETPGLIKTYAVAKNVYQTMLNDFNQYFNQNGYELLSLTELGFAYFYSQKPIASLSDIRKTKMWVWKGDAFAHSFLNALGIPSISVSFTDVLPSLQTGLIDGVYSTPTGLLSLQWQGQISYMIDRPITLVSGGIVLSKKRWDMLSPFHQKIVRAAIINHSAAYRRTLHAKEEESIAALKKLNIKILKSRDKPNILTEKSAIILQQFPDKLRARLLKLLP